MTPPLFSPLRLRDLELDNRIVVSPMCQYSADEEGTPRDWHVVHLGGLSMSGASLVFVEATSHFASLGGAAERSSTSNPRSNPDPSKYR